MYVILHGVWFSIINYKYQQGGFRIVTSVVCLIIVWLYQNTYEKSYIIHSVSKIIVRSYDLNKIFTGIHHNILEKVKLTLLGLINVVISKENTTMFDNVTTSELVFPVCFEQDTKSLLNVK